MPCNRFDSQHEQELILVCRAYQYILVCLYNRDLGVRNALIQGIRHHESKKKDCYKEDVLYELTSICRNNEVQEKNVIK